MTKREKEVQQRAYARCAKVADGLRDQYIEMTKRLRGTSRQGPISAAEACRNLREVFLEFRGRSK